MQRSVFFLACLVICATLTAQQYPFVHYTPREGLANNRVKFVFQDSKGKLYFSTYGGLSVYDGSRFINYTINNGLAFNMINDIAEMGEDSVWLLTNSNKINCLVNGKMKTFTPADNFTPLVNQFIKCSDGCYYALADEGLFRLDKNRFIKIPFPKTADGPVIKTFLQGVEADKKLYLLFNPDYQLPASNILVYDLRKNKIIGFSKSLSPVRLFLSPQKQVWLLTYSGIYRPLVNEDTKAIVLQTLPDSLHIPKKQAAFYAYIDRQQNTWLSTDKGVLQIKKSGEKNLFTVQNGLTTNFQTSIFQDFENNIWFTNEETGLSKLSNRQLAYYPSLRQGYSISDIYINPTTDSVWMNDGYNHKLLLLQPDSEIEEFKNTAEPLSPSARIVGNWVLSGTCIYSLHAKSDRRYSLTPVFKDTANAMGFGYGTLDTNGNLIAVSNKIVVLTKNKLLLAPIHYIADQIAVDKYNHIWVTTRSNQLYCYNISADTLSLLQSFSSAIKGSPRSITADANENIWIGTRDQGLYCLHFNQLALKSVRQLTTVDGLSENFVSYLYCDNQNNIWACTPSGLDRIKISNNHFQVENITAGNNLYFPIIKIQQTKRGVFWALSSSGIITYNPEQIANNWKPQLNFSEIIINNESRSFTGNELKYSQNNLVFQLSAPTFIDEKQTRFSYLLQGSGNDKWSIPSANASINFVNLPPGNYTLRAKAIFLHGLYPDTEASYSFVILPPWWQTWWFRLSMILFIGGLLTIALRFYYNRKLEKQKLISDKQRAIEKERTRIATDMHDDLGSGLSRIKFLSETIGMKKQQHLPIEEEISSIRTYSHEMIDKMGEIVWALNEKNDSLEDLLSYTRSYAAEYLQENGIHCTVNEPDAIPAINVSGEFRRNIYLTVKETLHNIVKHAQATEVIIDIEINNWLSIKIKDNGIGIDDFSANASGNGLLNMNSRIKTLRGQFRIENKNGTEVSIKIPLLI